MREGCWNNENSLCTTWCSTYNLPMSWLDAPVILMAKWYFILKCLHWMLTLSKYLSLSLWQGNVMSSIATPRSSIEPEVNRWQGHEVLYRYCPNSFWCVLPSSAWHGACPCLALPMPRYNDYLWIEWCTGLENLHPGWSELVMTPLHVWNSEYQVLRCSALPDRALFCL